MLPIKDYIQHPRILIESLLRRYGGWIPDKPYLQMMFFLRMRKRLNLENPQTFNEKLQWLKLYNHKPEYTMMVDKVKVKDYVAYVLGEKYVIPTLGVWDDPDKINFDRLPNRFVLKLNHNSGTGMYICKDKAIMDVDKVKKELRRGLKEDYYRYNREWPYKDVPRRIIAEKYMEDDSGELRDYKFFCFDGEVKALFIATDRSKGDHETRFDFFDADFNQLHFTNGHPNATITPKKPKMFEEMKALASKLSKGIPHVRIDFYEVENRVLFGEMTFFHWSGMTPYEPIEWDYKFGSWLYLPTHAYLSNN